MLRTLLVKNFALINKLELDFGNGLNIITGETGAGKSIIIDALMIVLGERASADFVRSGEKKAVIEAHFELGQSNPLYDILEEEDYDIEDGELILRREILAKGSSRCFLNDTPIQVGRLKEFGDYLVDFHGQHDHQLMLKKDSHIRILDVVADIDAEKQKYTEKFNELKSAVKNYKSLSDREKQLKSREEHLRFELEEIEKVSPEKDEAEGLERELKILQNSEILFNLTSELFAGLYENDNAVRDVLTDASKKLEELLNIDPQFADYLNECKSAIISIDEIAKFVKDYNGQINFDSERIEEIRGRLLQLQGLRKKYGTFDAVIDRWESLKEELSLIDNFDGELETLRKNIKKLKTELGKSAAGISKARKTASKTLNTQIVKILSDLGINHAAFEVDFKSEILEGKATPEDITAIIDSKEYRAYPDGSDKVEFLISTNKGETPKPLVHVASGGEISRIMLAIKSIIAESDSLPILVFDEIDTGISGKIARKTGIAMKKLAERHQIVAITHLPQIAALGDNNISVIKSESNGKTSISAAVLEDKNKLIEVAKLLSGDDVTDAALKSAKELSLTD